MFSINAVISLISWFFAIFVFVGRGGEATSTQSISGSCGDRSNDGQNVGYEDFIPLVSVAGETVAEMSQAAENEVLLRASSSSLRYLERWALKRHRVNERRSQRRSTTGRAGVGEMSQRGIAVEDSNTARFEDILWDLGGGSLSNRVIRPFRPWPRPVLVSAVSALLGVEGINFPAWETSVIGVPVAESRLVQLGLDATTSLVTGQSFFSTSTEGAGVDDTRMDRSTLVEEGNLQEEGIQNVGCTNSSENTEIGVDNSISICNPVKSDSHCVSAAGCGASAAELLVSSISSPLSLDGNQGEGRSTIVSAEAEVRRGVLDVRAEVADRPALSVEGGSLEVAVGGGVSEKGSSARTVSAGLVAEARDSGPSFHSPMSGSSGGSPGVATFEGARESDTMATPTATTPISASPANSSPASSSKLPVADERFGSGKTAKVVESTGGEATISNEMVVDEVVLEKEKTVVVSGTQSLSSGELGGMIRQSGDTTSKENSVSSANEKVSTGSTQARLNDLLLQHKEKIKAKKREELKKAEAARLQKERQRIAEEIARAEREAEEEVQRELGTSGLESGSSDDGDVNLLETMTRSLLSEGGISSSDASEVRISQGSRLV